MTKSQSLFSFPQVGQGVMEVTVVVGGATSTAMEVHTHITGDTSNTTTHSNHHTFTWTTLLLFICCDNDTILEFNIYQISIYKIIIVYKKMCQ